MPTLSSTFAHARAPFLLVPLLAALAAAPAQAAGFTISGSSSTAQTLSNGTGSVTAGGTLDVHDGSIAVTITGNGTTLDNQGTLKQSGSGANANRAIRDNTGVTGLTINNGSATNSTALIQTADGDVVQMNKAKSSVTLNNYGAMVSLNASAGGSQAVDFNAVTGANVVNNYSTGLLKALEADAVRPGVGGVVNNWGTILSVTTAGASSDGVDAQSNSGVAVNNNAGSIEGGRHGVTGGAANASTPFTMMVANLLGATIRGDNGSGMNIDGFNGKELVTVNNAGLIVGRGVTGDGDGVDVDGLVNLVNTGVIRSLNAVDPAGTAFSEGLSVGGGTITNSGTIEGLVAVGNTTAKGVGITLTGNDVTATTRDGLYGNATVTNQAGGLIRGQNSSGIVIKGNPSAFSATIANNVGAMIQGGGATDAAIQAGVDPVTVSDAGKIDGSSSGRAFAGGGGNVSFNITGGAAVVLGDIDGGAASANKMTISPGAGNSFAFAAGISNFASVEIASGTVMLSGSNGYTGTTIIDAGATLVLAGANRLAAASQLDLEGGMLKLVDVHGADGQEFALLSLGKDSAIDLGDSSLTFDALGSVVAGTTLSVTDYLAATSPGYALRFLGDLTGNAAFLALLGGTTVDGASAQARFDGVYTDVTAVPEPANVALLLAALGLLGATARRRRKAPHA
jgi:PEP-CTERM motif